MTKTKNLPATTSTYIGAVRYTRRNADGTWFDDTGRMADRLTTITLNDRARRAGR